MAVIELNEWVVFGLVFLAFFLCTQLISYGVRLDWWLDPNNGCKADRKEQLRNGKNDYVFGATIAFVVIVSLFVVWKIYQSGHVHTQVKNLKTIAKELRKTQTQMN